MQEIIFDKISILNFLSIGQAEIDLQDQNFTIVRGINSEGKVTLSNGAGKSSLFEAIFWTLTGETLRGSSNVVNENASDGCVCTLTLSDELNTYEIKRSRKHSKLGTACYFSVNGDLLSDQLKKSEALIAQMLPSVANAEILGSIILLGQGLPYRFSSFTPMKRKELLETIVSSSESEELSNTLKKKSGEIVNQISTLALEITKTDGIIQGLKSTIDFLEHQKQSFKTPEEFDRELETLRTQKHDLVDQYNNNCKELRILYERLTEIKGLKQEKESEQLKFNSSIATLDDYLSSLKSGNCPTCGRPYEVTPEMEQRRSSLMAKRDGLIETLKTIKNEITSYTQKYNEINERYNGDKGLLRTQYRIESTLKDIDRQIEELENNRASKDEIIKQIALKQEEIQKLKINQQKMTSDSNQYNKELECIDYLLRLTSREFKSYLVKEVIAFLSNRTAYYSQYLFSDKEVTITLSGNKILISLNNRPYENLSGGERQRTDLIVQFALRDLLIVVSGFSTNLLILDEAFDNLDAQGSEDLVRLVLTELSGIDSVYIITHHEELGIPYDNQLIIEKGPNGISRVRQEL